ncbi:uncharacterized protein LOC109949733 [Prunus persica]|uniref:uncharacterized protein LOC109949733 n=1 Tax=Prunus persica TaxID=3760 RepID=UPI0009AB27A1|nr:uncharacterized protein LOC109949733 [Prunus persica]
MVISKIWHFTKYGGYTVKSGYDLAIKLRRNGVIGKKGKGECSNQSGQSGPWKHIWALQVPPKIQMFIWRCYRNVLAVRENLRRRRVDVEADCLLCGNNGKTEVHLFFRCEIARLFWFASPSHLDVHGVEGEDFLSCWECLLQKFAQVEKMDEILQIVAFGLWRIWKWRNAVVFERQSLDPMDLVRCLFMRTNEYREVHSTTKVLRSELLRPPDKTGPHRRTWQKTPSRTF